MCVIYLTGHQPFFIMNKSKLLLLVETSVYTAECIASARVLYPSIVLAGRCLNDRRISEGILTLNV